MKSAIIFALVATASAQDGSQGAQSQGAQSQGAQSQGAQGAQSGGYGDQGGGDEGGYAAPAQESYAAPQQSYSAPSYEAAAAPAYVAAPKCCVHESPSHAPFFSLAQCGCLAGVQYAENSYQGHEDYAQPSYAAQQSYGGAAQGGAQQQGGGYRVLQENDVGNQPANTVDTRKNVLSSTGRVTLWIGFIILFLCGWTFINRALRFHYYADNMDLTLRQLAFLSGPAMMAGFVCMIAALAYLTMATGNGFYTRCCDGRAFFFARYIDWVLTTPIMLHGLVHFAGGSDDTFVYLFFMGVLMIVSGLIASVVCGTAKWFFFGFSILTFIPVIYYICWLRSKAVDTTFDFSFFFWNYSSMANLTAIAWFCYPIVWLCSEGLGVLSADGEAITYTVLDLISKCLFGMLIVSSRSIAASADKLMAALIAANIALENSPP